MSAFACGALLGLAVALCVPAIREDYQADRALPEDD